MEAFVIEPAGEGDVEAVIPLFEAQLLEHGIETPMESLPEVVRRVIADPRYGLILVARADRRLIGAAYVAAHLTVEHGGMIGWIEELYVLPEWRGAGVGSRLLEAVAVRAQELGWRGLGLEVVAGHERVIPLYKRHQFQALPRTLFTRIFPL